MINPEDPNEHLAIAAASGDSDAWLALCKQFEPFIIKTARKYYRMTTSMTVEDLKQEGFIAILEMCNFWKPGHGTKFASYLMAWLPYRLVNQLDDTDRMIRIPRQMAVSQRTAHKEGRPAPGIAIAWSHTQIERVVGLGLEDNGDDEKAEGLAVVDAMPGTDPLTGAEVAELYGFFSQLSERTQQVIAMYIGSGLNFYEIGEILGISHQGATQSFDTGIAKLRKLMGVSRSIKTRYRQTIMKSFLGEYTQSDTLDDKSALKAA